jgi:hypothetical protein
MYNPLQGCGGNNDRTTDGAGECGYNRNMVAQWNHDKCRRPKLMNNIKENETNEFNFSKSPAFSLIVWIFYYILLDLLNEF